MADVKITELAALGATPDDADVLVIVDDIAGTATTKKIIVSNLHGGLIPKSTFTQDSGIIVGTGSGAYQEETGATARLSLNVSCALDAISRSQFAYSDADQITCAAASYMCKDKYCYWVSTITTVATGAAAGIDWWYLYLDYSAITSGTAITDSELIWSTTEPAWNTTYRQWMNGNDRCIFAVRTDGSSNILEFYHGSNFVVFADEIEIDSNIAPGNTWTDSSQIVPKFTTRIQVTFRGGYVDSSAEILYWRTNGQSGATGHRVMQMDAGVIYGVNTTEVITDNSGVIEVRYGGVTNHIFYTYTNGWFFPIGM